MKRGNQFTIGGIRIHAVSTTDVLRQIQHWIDERRGAHYVVAANVHVVMEARQRTRTKRAVAGADLVIPDGMPLVLVGRLRGFPLRERTDGPGLMAAALEKGIARGWRHYFYGSSPEVIRALQSKTRERWPKIQIVGSHSPPFRTLTADEDEATVDEINVASPDVLWIGLGCPKQEHWMWDHRDRLHVPVMIGVGQALDLLAGFKTRAPVWMCRLGLEWAYRLGREPRRLWKRYLLYNPWFLWLVLGEQLRLLTDLRPNQDEP